MCIFAYIQAYVCASRAHICACLYVYEGVRMCIFVCVLRMCVYKGVCVRLRVFMRLQREGKCVRGMERKRDVIKNMGKKERKMYSL